MKILVKKNRRLTFIFLSFILLFSIVVLAEEQKVNPKVYSLEECIQEAIKNHPKLKISRYIFEQKKEKLNSLTAGYLSQVDAGVSYDRLSYVTQAKKRYLGNSQDDYQADIVVTQPLFTGGKITSQKQAVRYAIEAAEQGYLTAKEEVVFGVKPPTRNLFSRAI
ncbi:MAG: TolC family protein [Candidatus Omnitrophica bacterium]|nr:TolC family protein [Candidatus Omnitrophota bacterium]